MTRHPSHPSDAIKYSGLVPNTLKDERPAPALVRATEEDIPALARIHVSALSSNLLFRLCWRNQKQHYANVHNSLERMFKDPEVETWVVKAVNDDGTIQGWGIWSVREADLGTRNSSPLLLGLGNMNTKELEACDGEQDIDIEDFPIVPGLPRYIHSYAQAILDDWLLGKKHLLLNGLFVSPKFQNRGIGTVILKWGNERADKEGMPCFLQNPGGRSLYKDLGWKNIGMSHIELRDWVRGGGADLGWGSYKITYGVRLPDVWKGGQNERA